MSWFARSKEKAMPEEDKASAADREYTDAELLAMKSPPDRHSIANWTPRIQALGDRWRSLHADKERAEASVRVKEYEAADEVDRQASRLFVPNVTVKSFVAGDFLCVGEHEIPRRYIESVKVESVGSAPELGITRGFYRVGYYARPPHPAHISVSLASGANYTISVSRHNVDAMFEAIKHAWKHGKASE